MSAEDTQAAANSDSGSALVQIASYLIIGVFVLFELIAGEYFVTNVALVVAIAVVVLPRIAVKATEAIAPLPSLTKVGGYLLAFSGAIEFLDEIRFDAFDGFVSVVGALVAYAAYVIAFIGARSIKA